MRVSKSVTAVGGVVLAGALIGFTNPNAVHAAVTALLVQVTNTSSNPVVSSEETLAPAQIVQLLCSQSLGCIQLQPGGGYSADHYVVPTGRALVVTDIDVYTSAHSGTGTFGIGPMVTDCASCASYTSSLSYVALEDGLTHHFSLAHGIVWPSGAAPIPNGTPDLSARLYGYLASN